MAETLDLNELKARVLLSMIPEIGPVRANRLLKYFGSIEAAFKSTAEEVAAAADITPSLAGRILCAPTRMEADREIEKAGKSGVRITAPENSDYPASLKNISDPPVVLYYRGSFEPGDIFSVAVVGTRRPTNYGQCAAEHIVRGLVKAGITVVSGLARGIDTCAHKTVLKNGGRTVAVLGNGMGRHYPPENRPLEADIAVSGAVVTEFHHECEPDRQNFPQRNRLIAGLSLGTIVIEGDDRSGSMITARFAAEQGKDVFAVPGSIFSKYSRGPHRLLREGAILAQSAEDIIGEIAYLADWITEHARKANDTAPEELSLLTPDEQDILREIGKQPQGAHIDRLHLSLGKSFGELAQELVNLELKGAVKSLPGKLYIKTAL